MTPHQRKMRAKLEREYLADLKKRTMKASCSRCGAPKGKPCIFLDGPRRGKPMAGCHGDRSDEANRLGYVKGKHFWRCRNGAERRRAMLAIKNA